MISNNLCRNAGHGRTFLRLCHTQAKQQAEPVTQPYGYVLGDDGFSKRDKEIEGVTHVGRINLPVPLKDSLKLYYKHYPRKKLIEDGLKLSRHIANRGRPTHATWEKYKQEVGAKGRRAGGKAKDRNLVRQFSLEEAVREGLVSGVAESEGDQAAEDDTTGEILEGEETPEGTDEDTSTDKKQKTKPKTKRPQLSSYSMIRYGSREASAFAASLLPSVYGSTFRALHEIKKRVPDYEPRTLLDFGSGTGMSVWAADTIWKDSITEYQCVDVSDHMNKAAEFLLRGSYDIKKPLKVPNVYFKQFLPLSNQIKYDVVIAAYTLSEMPFQKQRLQALQSLWRKTNDFLVLIEPGNNEGFEIALQARRFIVGKDDPKEEEYDYACYEDEFGDYDLDVGDEVSGHIFAPCTHEMICARTDVNTRDHPCNFNQKVELSYAHRTTFLKRFNYFNERFSYIILRKGLPTADDDSSSGWTRILEPIKRRRRHVICELCCHNGNIEKHLITKRKDPDIYKASRHFLEWGDMMPLNKVKRPMNIRPSPSSSE